MINCIVDGKKSTKCEENVKVCIWKQMADKTMKHMCGPSGVTIATAAVCYKHKDGKMECHCNTENCNGECTPGTWVDNPEHSMTTAMKGTATEMGTGTAKTMTPTKPEQAPGARMSITEAEKTSADAVCKSATEKMTTVDDKKTNGPIDQQSSQKDSKMGTTSESPVTKAAVHVVIGVFILITPFFN